MTTRDDKIYIPTHEELIQHVDEFLKETGIKESAFGRKAFNNSSFISSLRDGNDPRLSTMLKLYEDMKRIRKDKRLQKMFQDMME